MSKMIIIEGNSDDKDQTRNYFVKGEKGDPGVSPTVETSKTGKVATITITDAEGEHTFTLNDGENGETANIIDSDTLTDNTKETYSGRIADTRFLQNSKLAYISDTMTLTPPHTQHVKWINMPTGFTFSNCVILSAMIDGGTPEAYGVFPQTGNPQCTVVFYDNSGTETIMIVLNKEISVEETIDVKIVLMKVS